MERGRGKIRIGSLPGTTTVECEARMEWIFWAGDWETVGAAPYRKNETDNGMTK